jgi:outer membrane immunogenic protein
VKKLALTILAAIGLSTAANAADMAVKARPLPPPAPVFSWTGFYIGVNAGGGWNKDTGDNFCINPGGVVNGVGCNVAPAGTVTPSGGLAGAQAGYNAQSGAFVWGLEADIQWSGIRDSSSVAVACCNPAPLPNAGTFNSSHDFRWFGTVRGRLGVAVAERGLIYGTGGLIYGEEAVSFALVFPLITYAAAASSIRTGWTAGAGFEYAFTNNLTGKVEALYYDMGTQTIAVTSPVSGYTLGTTYDYKGVIARAGLNWKFGGPVVAKY